MGQGDGGGRKEAERWLSIAEKLLEARDLVGSKEFAERSLECDPLLDGVDQILAVADVLLAAQRHVNNQVNWYSILQLDPSTGGRDPSAVKRQYRRLALLLNPDRNKAPGADAAFKHVVDAWAVLSDPSKKSLFDAELEIAAAHFRSNPPQSETPPRASVPAGADLATFWTACPFCCHVYQFTRAYQDRTLRCPTCQRGFHAAEIAAPPPIVPGTDMYYCSWGFFPLGFPGGPGFRGASNSNPTTAGVPDFGSGWKPFYPMSPWWGNQPAQASADGAGESQANAGSGRKENVADRQWSMPGRNRKKVARKKVGSNVKNTAMGGAGSGDIPVGHHAWAGTAGKPTGININEEVEVVNVDEEAGPSEGADANANAKETHIDLEATDELLGNLQNLPFLKDEEIQLENPKEF